MPDWAKPVRGRWLVPYKVGCRPLAMRPHYTSLDSCVWRVVTVKGVKIACGEMHTECGEFTPFHGQSCLQLGYPKHVWWLATYRTAGLNGQTPSLPVMGLPGGFCSCGLRPAPLQVLSGSASLAVAPGCKLLQGPFRVKGPPRLGNGSLNLGKLHWWPPLRSGPRSAAVCR